MVVITFPNKETQKKAFGSMLGRFPGKVLSTGEHIVPEAPWSSSLTAMLPAQFKDGEIPEEWLGEASTRLSSVSAALAQSHAIEGGWRNEGVHYRDELARNIVDVPDNATSRKWMKKSKSTKSRGRRRELLQKNQARFAQRRTGEIKMP